MAQTASKVDLAYDWELWLGRESAPGANDHTWTQIFGFEALPFPEQDPEEVDVTHMQSPARTRETIPGFLSISDWSQEKQYWPTDAGDILLEELAALTAAGTKEDVLLEFNLDPAGAAARRTYRGFVNQFTPTGTVGDKAMASLSVKIMDRQPTNTRNIAASVAPVNTLLPSISGIAQVDVELTAIEGAWTNSPNFTYQWQTNSGTWGDIVGATNKAFTPLLAQQGQPLRVVVTGTNSAGNNSATSAATANTLAA